MNVIVTLDDRGGMLFNCRRQSRDRVLNERILQLCGGKLRLNAYSAKLFAELPAELTVAEDFLDRAQDDDWCFVEDRHLVPYAGKIGKLAVYRWNRLYPNDFAFDLDLAAWKRLSQTEFAGSSHEKITEEVYIR